MRSLPTRIALCTLALLPASCDRAGTDGTPAPATKLGVDEIPLQIDQRCPGDPSCPSMGGDGRLLVGAAKRDVTPFIEPFVDANGNGAFDEGEPYTDLNRNGRFDRVWIAGYGSGRLAYGVHDPTWVRCFALRQGETTVVECAVDCVGLFHDEQKQVEADLDPALGVDLFLYSATHVHESQDTVGIWGADDTTTGYDPDYMRRVRRATVEAVTEAVGALAPAKMSIGSIAVEDAGGDMSAYVADTRDPVVIDNRLHLMQFDRESDGKPIVTVINWSSHPEMAGGDNHYISSDFVHYLRESVEAGTGSDVVYVSGSLGGLLTPLHTSPVTDDGVRLPNNERSFRATQAIGHGVARFALKAFAARTEVSSPKLAFRRTSFNVHVENLKFHTAVALGTIREKFFGYDHTQPLIRTDELDNSPLTRTGVAYLTLGPAAIVTVPGELLPENFVGGYDGSYAGAYPLVDTQAENAPDLSRAPKGPYLIDEMGGAFEHRMVFGLTLDFLGYIIPRYDFVLDPIGPYISEAKNHYEETNSLGPRADPEIVGTMRQLIESAKDVPVKELN